MAIVSTENEDGKFSPTFVGHKFKVKRTENIQVVILNDRGSIAFSFTLDEAQRLVNDLTDALR